MDLQETSSQITGYFQVADIQPIGGLCEECPQVTCTHVTHVTHATSDFQQHGMQYNDQQPDNFVEVQSSRDILVDIRHEGTKQIREYWASKKQEQRRRKRQICPMNYTNSTNNSTEACKMVVKCWQNATKEMNSSARKETFQHLLQHPTFQKLQPKIESIQSSIVCNIKHTMNQVKVPHSSEELKFKRATCMMMLNSESGGLSNVNQSQMARFLGLHRRNFCVANSRLHKGKDGELPLHLCQRQWPVSSIITTEVKDLVFEFWSSETRVSPNKKDVCRKRMGRAAYTRHPVQLLDETQVELYKRFREKHPEVRISLRCFEKLKPYFVRKLRDRYTCCCIYHVQMIYLKDALNLMRQQSRAGPHGSTCDCRCPVCMSDAGVATTCRAANHSYTSTTTLWESVLCAKPTDAMYHSKSCLMGECKECGTQKLLLCPEEVSTNDFLVTVKVFEDIVTGNNDEEGSMKTRKDVVRKQMGCKDFTSFLKRHITSFIKHNYLARWQSQQYRDCLTKFPTDVVVSVIDFAENYTFKEQNEIQSMHWFNSQVTILVHITYVRPPSSEVQKFIHFYISDDRTHDTLFVQHCLQLHCKWLEHQGFNFLKRHWVWSDGCAAQFKARRPFFFVSRYYQLTGLEMMWNYFASGHGKGEHDGAGAVIKRTLTHEQLKPNGYEMKCAADVVIFLQHNFCDKESHVGVNRVFWEIKEIDVQREEQWNCKKVKGSRSLHCVNGYSSIDRCALRSRSLSCFCDFCISERWRRCLNRVHIKDWTYIAIEPNVEGFGSDESSDDGNGRMPMYAGHHDALSDALCAGDNFATNASEEGADFYILKCSKAKHKATKALRDAWGNCVSARSYVVEGFYYEKVNGEDDVYYIPDGQPHVILASHLVRAIKFEMEPVPGWRNKFKLSSEVHESIYNSMPLEF